MKPSSSIAREMSGWIASSPKRAVGGARVNVSPVLIYMLTAETLAVNELFQRKAIQFGDDLFGIGFRARPRLAGRGVTQSDDRGDRILRNLTICVLADFALRNDGEVGIHSGKYRGRRRECRLPRVPATVRGLRADRG